MTRRLDVAYRGAARSDLDRIFWYVIETTRLPRTAHAYVRRIEERCRRLIDAPLGGKPRNDLAAGLRVVPFEHSAVICYVVEGDTIWITNIFRRGRDYEAILRGGPAADDGE